MAQQDYDYAPGQIPTPEVERNFGRGGARGGAPAVKFGYTPPAQTTQTDTAIGGATDAVTTQGLSYQQLMGIGNIMGMNDQNLQAQLAAMQANAQANIAGAQAGAAGIAAQRDAANYALQSGLRDIGQETEAGMEAATFNAQQRGIYDSGIRKENQATVQREGAEAEADLRANTQFQLRALNARAGAIRSQISALRQAAAAQATAMTSTHQLQQNQWLAEQLGMGVDYEDVRQQMFDELFGSQPSGGGGATYQ